MASGSTLFIPSNEANMIQTAAALPSVVLQASGATPYPQYEVQQLQISTSAPQQAPQKGPLEIFLNAEPKVLGAVQILIGLIHIGFGAVSLFKNISPNFFFPISSVGGYPFWGGIFFISSGSLCVAAANSSNHRLVKTSVGLNITSAVMALIGIILYLCDLTCNGIIFRYYHRYDAGNDVVNSLRDAEESLQSVGRGLSSVLLLFSMLEFCIAVPLAHFGCQATCRSGAQPTVLYVPYQVIRGEEVAAEPNPPPSPPTYDNVVTKSQ